MISQKEKLRGEIKKRIKSVLREEFHSQGEKAAALLCSSEIWSFYSSVYLFLSMDSEIDTQPLLEAAFQHGKKVFAPAIENGRLAFYLLQSAKGPWIKGPFSIREPADKTLPCGMESPAEKAKYSSCFPALVLAPGLAFDREGKRLGRGRGYYDRFFSELDNAGLKYSSLGFCMDFQIIERVPAGSKDKKMNGLLSGTELIVL